MLDSLGERRPPRVDFLYSVLSSVEAAYFQAFALPQHRPLFTEIGVSPTARLAAIGAHALHLPFGIALARVEPETRRAELLSLFVKKRQRRKGIALEMLRRLESELRDRGCRELVAHYEKNRPYSKALDELLLRSGFSPPETYALACRCLFDRMKEAPWLREKAPTPAAFEIFRWSELTRRERESLLGRQRISPWFPEELSPFSPGEAFEPLNSLGLRYRGEVVGWQINHRVAPDCIQYSITFAREDLQPLGLGILLMRESSRIQIELRDKRLDKAFFRVPLAMKGMLRYLETRLAPFVDEVSPCVKSVKRIA